MKCTDDDRDDRKNGGKKGKRNGGRVGGPDEEMGVKVAEVSRLAGGRPRLRKSEIVERATSNLSLAGDNFLSLRASQARPPSPPVVPIA